MSQDVPQHANRFEEEYLPMARTDDLVSTYSDGKVLLYDKRSHHIHHLGEEVTKVWHHCDGRSPLGAISSATGIPEERVRVALSELSHGDLLIEGAPKEMRVTRIDRRRMTKFGLATLPGIISISAPIAKAAATNGSLPPCIEPNSGQTGCYTDLDCCPSSWPNLTSFCVEAGGSCSLTN